MTATSLTRNQLRVVICLALALVTAALYWPLLHHGFVNLDDQTYITANAHVQAGLTGPGVAWAFQIGYAAYWHPLTWLSHMLDCQLFGLNAGGHHFTNLLFHILNTLLLFIWLNQLTNAVWRSAFVAALFAWHPLHVESVAWACERKDVLSMFFWMLTLITYTRHVTGDKWQATRTNSILSHVTCHVSPPYFLALFFFACGLMSKPMVVTLPFVLLLLDFWPIQRLVLHSHGNGGFNSSTIQRLLLEKIPFFALAFAGSVVTYFAQKGGGAVWSVGLPLPTRLANALVSYLRYLSKTFWPVDLAVVYPYPHHWPVALVLAAVIVLVFWTGLFLWQSKRNPYWLVGWLWFLGTLVPTIGIVQVGPQSMADRFTYLPGIGLFIIVAWGLNDLANFRPRWRPVAMLVGPAALAGCLVVARTQLNFWPDSITLLRHAVAVTTDNYIAYNSLGRALEDAGDKDNALDCYLKSVQIESHFPYAQFNLGMAWLNRGQPAEAVSPLSAAVQLVPDNAEARYYLGTALMETGKLEDAIAQLTESLRLKPDLAAAHNQLALALIKQGKTTEAIPHFAGVVRLQPDNPEARFNLGFALLNAHQPAQAAVQFAEELRLKPDETRAHYRLAQALQQLNQPAEAARHYREALRLTPEFPEAKKELNVILAAHPELR
jgi:protein O-mannosyl-transferase